MIKNILLTIGLLAIIVFSVWAVDVADLDVVINTHNPDLTSHFDYIWKESALDDLYLRTDGTVPLTADWDAGNSLFDITAVEFKGALIGNADTTTEVGTLTTGDMCTNDGSAVNCTTNTLAELSTALDNQATKMMSVTITNGDTAIDASVTDPVWCSGRIANNMKITAWYLNCDQSGSIVIDVWKNTWDDTPEANTDSIAGTEKPTLSSDVSNSDTSLTSMTADWDAGEQVCFEIESAATCTKCWLDFYGYLD